MNSPETLSALQRLFGLQLSSEQREKVASYLHLLKGWNRKVSLTSLRSVEDQLRFHFFESFWAALHFLQKSQAVADVGTGAGFPGLAMKLYQPSLKVTLIEKNYRKVVFLKEVSRRLNLPVEIFHGRGESYPGWASQQCASLRALKLSPPLLELLARHRVSILLFSGRQLAQRVESLHLVRQERVPGSTDRYVRLLSPRST